MGDIFHKIQGTPLNKSLSNSYQYDRKFNFEEKKNSRQNVKNCSKSLIIQLLWKWRISNQNASHCYTLT